LIEVRKYVPGELLKKYGVSITVCRFTCVAVEASFCQWLSVPVGFGAALEAEG